MKTYRKMTLKIAIGRAQYVRQLVAPTKLGTKLPYLYADEPEPTETGESDGSGGSDGSGEPSPE